MKSKSKKLSAIASKLIAAGHFDLVQQIIKADAGSKHLPSQYDDDIKKLSEYIKNLKNEVDGIEYLIEFANYTDAQKRLDNLYKRQIKNMTDLTGKLSKAQSKNQ